MTGTNAVRVAPAVVYVGPTISAEQVSAALPGADLRPPVRRGDLHRDRQLHYSLFVIIDGVFLQDEALPPREVIDIIEDGAIVLGAASLGAIRAAELWPVGMFGYGLIYRLYRRSILVDEDEVAVLFDPNRPYPPLTAALVDIRWSLRKAKHRGEVTPLAAQSFLERARGMPFQERTWSHCGCSPETPGLKELDALTLLAEVRCLVRRDPSVLRRGRAHRQPFRSLQEHREAELDPWEGINRDSELEELRTWLQVHAGLTNLAVLQEKEIPGKHLLRYRAFRDGLALAQSLGVTCQAHHRLAAEYSLARVHEAENWSLLCRNPPIPLATLEEACGQLERILALRDKLFNTPSDGVSMARR